MSRRDNLELDDLLLTTAREFGREGRGVYVRFTGGQQFRLDPVGALPGGEPATDKQLAYIASLADEKGQVAPDVPLTKVQASEIIGQLQGGTYEPDKWVTVPF